MKKIYSIVLMAAALLVGTNAWAQQTITLGLDGSGADYTSLQAAFDAVPAGGTATIQLISENYTTNAQAWLGTKALAGTPKNITLDLGGYSYTYTGIQNVAIALTHGKLVVKNGSIETASAQEDLIRVYGTFEEIDGKTETPFSHFVLEESATLKTTKKNALVVDQLTKNHKATWVCVSTADFDYCTNIFASSSAAKNKNNRGLANGVKLEVLGNIEAYKYGIKVNGNVGYINDYLNEGTLTFKDYLPQCYSDRLPASYAITSKSLNGACAPYVFVGSNAKIKSDATATEAVAAYAAGFARWEIQGSCEGSTGLYAKSGAIEVKDAKIKSTNTNNVATQPGKTSGVEAGGSAIVIESNASYSGNTTVTISGDSHIEGTSGYAIEETKKAGTPDDVEAVVIQGGTIVGGDAGAIILQDNTVQGGKVTVVGGDFAGLIQTTDEEGNKKVGQVEDYIPASAEVHTTEVTVNGKTTIVISQGTTEPATANSVVGADDYKAIRWQNASVTTETISENKVLTELVISEAYNQTLNIAEGKKLIVGRVVLGDNAAIVVKPGASLIVTSVDGIDAHSASNIKLESNNDAQAVLIFHPGVTGNRHPKAAVELSIAAGKVGTESAWTRFAMPLQGLDALKRKNAYETWVYSWDYTAKGGQGDWALLANVKDMKSWIGYTMTYDNEGAQSYTFEGNLAGNANAPLNFVHKGYNYFGNSYSAYIDAKTLVESLPADIDGSVYMWNAQEQGYESVPMNILKNKADQLTGDEAWKKDISPLTTFILRLMDKDNAAASVNYASAIYNNPRHGNAGGAAPGAPTAAPSRHSAEQANMQMIVTAANGKKDRINLTENAEFTDAYDRGYDAAKFINENRINLYATINGENLSDVVTNDLEGKTISLQTIDEIAYTISFKNVEGNEYAVRDNVTGAVIAIEEGMTYEFAAQPNSTVEGRFEIVRGNKVATSIENTEVKANVKGIYTMTGQYVGEDFDVLPAGVYVVNGVKIVK